MPTNTPKTEVKMEASFVLKHGGKLIISGTGAAIGGLYLAFEKVELLQPYADKLTTVGLLFAFAVYMIWREYSQRKEHAIERLRNDERYEKLQARVDRQGAALLDMTTALATEEKDHAKSTSLFSSVLRYLISVRDSEQSTDEQRHIAGLAIAMSGLTALDETILKESGIWRAKS